MNHQEKKQLLKKLNEQEFRRDIIIPLLSKMGFISPVEYHGPGERGKDIICLDYDKLGEQRYLAIVAKTGDLTGNAATDLGLMNVVTQVSQALDNPYEEIYNMRSININEVWVMTTGKIVGGAEESVIGTLRKTNLDKQIRIIRDDRLVQLIDQHFPTYWNSTAETKETLIIQRDRLLSFIQHILKNSKAENTDIESIKQALLYSKYDPMIYDSIKGYHIAKVTPYSIEIGIIDEQWDDYIVSHDYGNTPDFFMELKEKFNPIIWQLEEILEKIERIKKITDPEEFVDRFYDELKDEYPFYKERGVSSKFMNHYGYFEDGLPELKRFKRFLEQKGKLEWAKNIAASIHCLGDPLTKIIEHCKESEVKINYRIDEQQTEIVIAHDPENDDIVFTTKQDLIDTDRRYEIEDKCRDRDGRILPKAIIGLALALFRKYLESTLGYDAWEDQ